jgi:hypothetical protein
MGPGAPLRLGPPSRRLDFAVSVSALRAETEQAAIAEVAQVYGKPSCRLIAICK